MTVEEIIGVSFVVFDKSFKFEGIHFKCWQRKKMIFLNLKKICQCFDRQILVVPSKPNEQTNRKNMWIQM